MRFSIRHKILGVLGLLLVSAVVCYTVLASFIFSEQKTALLYDLNHSIAVNTAAQLRASLTQVSSQLRLYALSQILSSQSEMRLKADFLQEVPVTGVRLFQRGELGLTEIPLPGTPSFKASVEDLSPLFAESEKAAVALGRIRREGEDSPFWVAERVRTSAGGREATHFIAAELNAQVFFQPLQASNLFRSSLVRGSGETLVALDRSAETSVEGVHPLLGQAKSVEGISGVASFDQEGEQWYGAYAPVGVGDLYFLTQASRKEVTGAILSLVERSVVFGLIVITLTFIASILFSQRLTRGILILTEGAKRIQEGDLESQIAVKSRDEIHDLAASFNAMVNSLKASRDEIERYNRELEDRVAQRTQQLREANASIKEVQEKLLKTTQLAAVGEVAGRTAHELLNPLTAILSRIERSRGVVQGAASGGAGAQAALPLQLSEILQAWETDYRSGGLSGLATNLATPSSVKPGASLFEEDLENLKTLAKYWAQQTQVIAADSGFVQEQSQRIHRIVDGMRELVRSSVKSDVRCQDAVKEALLTLADFLEKNQVSLVSEIQAKDDLATLNRDEFIQILTNLLRNGFQAIQARPPAADLPRGTLTVTTGSSGTLFWVDVIDNGVGIPEGNLHQIFEQGFTTKAPSEGTGLGLSICRRYAHAFGGEVEVLFSEPQGRGTCFRLTVPLKKVQEKLAS